MKNMIFGGILAASILIPGVASAADYKIDAEGAHASINFKIKHLGYSWLTGRFDSFSGVFSYDAAKPEASKIQVEIETASLDSNHAERDKHLRSGDFLDVQNFPSATFTSSAYKVIDENNGEISGELTLHGVSKTITFPVEKIGEGKDPWGGYRAGFSGKTSLKLSDYGINYNLGPASTEVELALHIEGIRQ